MFPVECAAECGCPNGWVYFEGSCYHLAYEMTAQWSEAEVSTQKGLLILCFYVRWMERVLLLYAIELRTISPLHSYFKNRSVWRQCLTGILGVHLFLNLFSFMICYCKHPFDAKWCIVCLVSVHKSNPSNTISFKILHAVIKVIYQGFILTCLI